MQCQETEKMWKKKEEKKQVNARRKWEGRNKSKVDIEVKWCDGEKGKQKQGEKG